MQREKGHQTLCQTDKAIYLASQLSSMQLLSANNRKGKGKVYQLLVKHQDVRDGVTETQTVEAGETV